MPPGIPALGKAVAEDDERSFTLLGDVQADAVRLDHPMRHLGRRRIHPGCRLRASPAGLGGSGFKRLRESRADGQRAPRPEHVAPGKRRISHCVAPLIATHLKDERRELAPVFRRAALFTFAARGGLRE
jgi:hypothetical protein